MNNNMYYGTAPKPKEKPSEKDFLAKVPFWAILVISYVCIAFGRWYSIYTTMPTFLNMFDAGGMSVSFNGMFAAFLIIEPLISLAFNYVIAILFYTIFLRATKFSVKIPKNSLITIFMVANSLIALIEGAINFIFITNPIYYIFVSTVVSAVLIIAGVFLSFFYIIKTYEINSLEKSLLMVNAIMPYLVIMFVFKVVLGVII